MKGLGTITLALVLELCTSPQAILMYMYILNVMSPRSMYMCVYCALLCAYVVHGHVCTFTHFLLFCSQRFDDAGFYYWLLTKSALESAPKSALESARKEAQGEGTCV